MRSSRNLKKWLMSTSSNIVAHLKEYCEYSGLHGVRYLSEERRNIVEKVFWTAVLIFCAVGSSLMIVEIKERLDTAPVIVTIAETPTSVWRLPFPAVTICSGAKSLKHAFNWAENLDIILSSFVGDHVTYGAFTQWITKKVLFIQSQLLNFTERELLDLPTRRITIDSGFTGNIIREYGLQTVVEISPFFEKMSNYLFAMPYSLRVDELLNATWLEDRLESFFNTSFVQENFYQYNNLWLNSTLNGLKTLQAVCKRREKNLLHLLKTQDINADELDDSDIAFLVKASFDGYHPTFGQDDLKSSYYERSGITIQNTLTEEGVCFTFNMLDSSQIYNDHVVKHQRYLGNVTLSNDWNPDAGYLSKSGLYPYPRRPLGIGADRGFNILLPSLQRNNFDTSCATHGSPGFKVILHRPEEQPQTLVHTVISVPFDKVVSITINPRLTVTSSALKNYDPHKRYCYYADEKHLEYFKVYTQNNCALECLTNATLQKCGCVAFYMPRSALEEEARNDVENTEDGEDTFSATNVKKTVCDCLPSCISIHYTCDTTMDDTGKIKDWLDINDDTDVSISVFYKDHELIATRRNELYGPVEFLANCGGILGLFCGFSLMSVIEFLYFFLIRPWSDIVRRFILKRRSPELKRTEPAEPTVFYVEKRLNKSYLSLPLEKRDVTAIRLAVKEVVGGKKQTI